MDLCLWKKGEWENADKEDIGSCDWDEERICAKEEKGIFIVEERERRDVWVHWRTIEKRVY